MGHIDRFFNDTMTFTLATVSQEPHMQQTISWRQSVGSCAEGAQRVLAIVGVPHGTGRYCNSAFAIANQ
jgi:hypothetical protein